VGIGGRRPRAYPPPSESRRNLQLPVQMSPNSTKPAADDSTTGPSTTSDDPDYDLPRGSSPPPAMGQGAGSCSTSMPAPNHALAGPSPPVPAGRARSHPSAPRQMRGLTGIVAIFLPQPLDAHLQDRARAPLGLVAVRSSAACLGQRAGPGPARPQDARQRPDDRDLPSG